MKRTPNPQPSTDPPKEPQYSIYLWPRAKKPEIQRIYDYLYAHDWRFDATHMLWYTPEAWDLQGHGTLEHAEDGSWFRIQPRSSVINGVPHRADPLLSVQFEQVDA